jgi:hypothetical protein
MQDELRAALFQVITNGSTSIEVYQMVNHLLSD